MLGIPLTDLSTLEKAYISGETSFAVAPLPTLTALEAAAVVQSPARTAPEAAAVVQSHARTAPVRHDCIQRHKAVMLVFTQCLCRMCRWSPVYGAFGVGYPFVPNSDWHLGADCFLTMLAP